MNVELHASRLAVSKSTQAYVVRRIGFALGRFADVIETVIVSLEDINGPRGGVDKSCRIRVNLTGQRTPIIATVLDLEVRAAVDMAAERAGRAVARQLDRRTPRRFSERWSEPLQLAE